MKSLLKNYYSVSAFCISICIMGLFVSCTSAPKQQQAQPERTNTDTEKMQTEKFEKVEVYNSSDTLLFVLLDVKDVLVFTQGDEEIELVSFETSTGIDFVKVYADNSLTGIRAEYAWANYMYPDFKRQRQSLISIKINGNTLPCDLLLFENGETGEEKEIYFEISEFFGKF